MEVTHIFCFKDCTMSEYSPEQLEQALQNVRNELNQGHMQDIMKVRNRSVFVIILVYSGKVF